MTEIPVPPLADLGFERLSNDDAAIASSFSVGTKILRHLLVQADALRLPVRLEYLQWNPVGSLYLRNGVVPTHGTDIHIFLERPVPG